MLYEVITKFFNILLVKMCVNQIKIVMTRYKYCQHLNSLPCQKILQAYLALRITSYNVCYTKLLRLSNLIVSAPYVFAFVPEINSVTVSGVLLEKEFKQTIIRGDTYPTNLENAKVMRINVSTNEKNKERYILTINNCDDFNLTLAVEIYSQNKESYNFV